jgi:hypothetical protein
MTAFIDNLRKTLNSNANVDFAHIAKSLKIVSGFASVEVRDTQGDLIDIDALDNAMYKFMTQSRSLHFEHSLPIGEILRWERREKDGKDAIWIDAYLYDNEAAKEIWNKIQNGEIHGFSIRGIAKNRSNGKITDLELYEISLVFQPANQEAILVNAIEKSRNGTFIQMLKSKLKPSKSDLNIKDVWTVYTEITNSLYSVPIDDLIAKYQKLKDVMTPFGKVNEQTEFVLKMLNDVIKNVESTKDISNKMVRNRILHSINSIFSTAFMKWFTDTDYILSKVSK